MGNEIKQILNMDLSQEEKEALLSALANELIENKSKDWENKNEELKEKSRKQAQDTRERQEKRDKEYALNYEIKKMEDALLKITNNRGEHVCTKESLNELSLGELEELYYRYFGEHKLDSVHEKYYGSDNRNQDKAQEVEVEQENKAIDMQDVPEQNEQVIPEVTEENNNVINSSDILEKQNKNDSNDTISEYNYGLPEENNVQQNSNMDNEQGRVIVKGRPANLFETVEPNPNLKVKRPEKKLINAYPLTVEELANSGGLWEETKKTVMKIFSAPKKIIDSIKRKRQERLEKKNKISFEENNIETQVNNDDSVILASPDGKLKTYSNDNELISNNLNNDNLNYEEVNNENVVNEVQENNGGSIILASPDGTALKQYGDNAEVTKVFAR